ncbi:MAG: Yip1 family protein [Candidatus Micrarchaeota archaeon]
MAVRKKAAVREKARHSQPQFNFDFFVELLRHPKENFSKWKPHSDLWEAVKLVAAGFAIAGLIVVGKMGLQGRMDAVSLISLPLGYAISGVIITLIGVGIFYLLSILFGGKGEFKQQYYLSMLFVVPLAIFNSAVQIVPVLGNFLVALSNLYSLYLLTLVLMEVHGFSALRAVLIWLIPFIVLIIFIAAVLTAAVAVIIARMAMLGG